MCYKSSPESNENSDYFGYPKGRSKPSKITSSYFIINSLGCRRKLQERSTYFYTILIIKLNNVHFCIKGFLTPFRHQFFLIWRAEIFMDFSVGWEVKNSKFQNKDYSRTYVVIIIRNLIIIFTTTY